MLAIAGRDERAGDVIIKAVNTGPEPADDDVRSPDARTIAPTGRLTVMSSPDPLDGESFEQPKLITPVTTTVTGLGRTFTRTLPPYSLSISVAAK